MAVKVRTLCHWAQMTIPMIMSASNCGAVVLSLSCLKGLRGGTRIRHRQGRQGARAMVFYFALPTSTGLAYSYY